MASHTKEKFLIASDFVLYGNVNTSSIFFEDFQRLFEMSIQGKWICRHVRSFTSESRTTPEMLDHEKNIVDHAHLDESFYQHPNIHIWRVNPAIHTATVTLPSATTSTGDSSTSGSVTESSSLEEQTERKDIAAAVLTESSSGWAHFATIAASQVNYLPAIHLPPVQYDQLRAHAREVLLTHDERNADTLQLMGLSWSNLERHEVPELQTGR